MLLPNIEDLALGCQLGRAPFRLCAAFAQASVISQASKTSSLMPSQFAFVPDPNFPLFVHALWMSGSKLVVRSRAVAIFSSRGLNSSVLACFK